MNCNIDKTFYTRPDYQPCIKLYFKETGLFACEVNPKFEGDIHPDLYGVLPHYCILHVILPRFLQQKRILVSLQ